ncbi:MAG: T9SS type A sorting domain-containing protein [Ignavibacteriales bacterium]|nr:T9SS type A sorting domain-containing protein [Ignavibacteriales bacterium]
MDENLASGKYLYRLKQIDFDGLFEYSNNVEVVVAVPDRFELSQNYPNPFNPSTKIKYTIHDVTLSPDKNGINSVEGSRVILKVYDILGTEVITLVNENKPAGNYEVTFDARTLSSGTYFYKLQAGSFVATKKLLLLK